MKIENYIKWFLFAFLSLFLVACKPTAKFEYSPIAPSVGEVVKFDASKSTVYKAKEGNKISIYAWNFGDGSQGTGQTVEHTYTVAGQYTVALTVTDSAGQTNSITQKVTVSQTTVASREVTITVHTADGASLPNATVTIQGQNTTTDQNGLANLKLTIPQGTEQVVAKFAKEGFITQSILVNVKDLSSLAASLLPIKDTISVSNIESPQTISATSLGATISIPENAFVIESTGVAAKGQVNVKITPWDITGADLNAMPANGFARDAKGNIVQLISAGMITAEFFDTEGNKLQLANGKTADIKMDLPITSLQNQSLTVGSAIPMWHFSEQEGLWIEQGTGYVVAEKDSKTGFAVQAKVNHFSTWNWDQPVVINEGGTAFVKCISGGQPIRCDVQFKIFYSDGSILSYKLNGGISENGFLFEGKFGLPKFSNVKRVEWNATSGLIKGTAISGTDGDQVTIKLEEPKSKNYIRCRLPDSTFVDCGVVNERNEYHYISKDGGVVVGGYEGDQKEWTAVASTYTNLQAIQYSGKVTSSAFANVIIDLKTKTIPYMVQCKLADGTSVACDVKADNGISFYSRASGQVYYLDGSTDLNWQAKTLPIQENGTWVQYSGNTFKVSANKIEIQLNQKILLGNNLRNIKLKCEDSGSSCDVRVFIIPKAGFENNSPITYSYDHQITIEAGTEVNISLPNSNPDDFVVFDSMYGDYSSEKMPGIPLKLLNEGQVITIPWDYSLYQLPLS